MANNQKKVRKAFGVCSYIAVVLGTIFLSTWTVKSASLVNSFQQEVQQEVFKEITGIVKTQDGEPIPGVVVNLRGTNQGTDTDLEGKYSLNVNEGDKIQFVYEGFKATTVTVSKSNILNITMIEDDMDTHLSTIEYYRNSAELKSKLVTTTPRIECGYPSRSFAEILKPFTPTIDYSPEVNRNPETILKDVENLTRNGNYTYIVDGMRVSEETFRLLNQNDVESVDIYKHTDIYNARFSNKENQSSIALKSKSF